MKIVIDNNRKKEIETSLEMMKKEKEEYMWAHYLIKMNLLNLPFEEQDYAIGCFFKNVLPEEIRKMSGSIIFPIREYLYDSLLADEYCNRETTEKWKKKFGYSMNQMVESVKKAIGYTSKLYYTVRRFLAMYEDHLSQFIKVELQKSGDEGYKNIQDTVLIRNQSAYSPFAQAFTENALYKSLGIRDYNALHCILDRRKTYVRDISFLSEEILDVLEMIKAKEVCCGVVERTYDIGKYRKCRRKMDELLDGILVPDEDNPDREKWIFGQVVRRLAKHISYDYMNLERMKEGLSYDKNCHNMIGALLNNAGVCGSYAETLGNVLSLYNIESRYITGETHAWNQVKLDGEWYNADLTWDRDRIVAGRPTRYLLKSDKDFEGHQEYKCDSGYLISRRSERCFNSYVNVDKFIYSTPPKNKKRVIRDSFLGLTYTEMGIAGDILRRSMTREEKWSR